MCTFGFVSLITELILIIYSTCQEMKYKIAVPKYICRNDEDKNNVKIRLLENGGQNLDYKWTVNFNKIGTCKNFQRCTLMAWKSVREFEKYLQNYSTVLIKQTGCIEINQTMLMPGIEYLLNVSVENDDGLKEMQQFKMDYMDETVPKPPIGNIIMGTVMLLGSDVTYADSLYIINAEITITCLTEQDYYLSWELLDSSGEVIKRFPDKGTELQIKPNTLAASKKYGIRSRLIDSTENVETHWVETLKRGLLINLPLKSVTVGLGQPITIRAFIKDPDNTKDELKIKWSVIKKDTGEKHADVPEENSTVLEMDSGFYETGFYTIQVEATKHGEVVNDSFEVSVKEAAIPVIEVDEFEKTVSATDELEIHTTVKQLTPGCTLQWLSSNNEQSEFIDLNNVPGNVNRVQTVEIKEELFLGELQEFSNETQDQQFDLKIARAGDSWVGLKGNRNYTFRLNVTCPQPLLRDDSDNNNTTEPIIENLYSFAEIEIHTNAPPYLKQLKVLPLRGEALRTIFVFETDMGEDIEGDLPILYKFGYMLDNDTIIFANLNYLTRTQTMLPYQADGVRTILEGCDNRSACNRTFGPLINTVLPASYDKTSLLNEFDKLEAREEYYKAYNLATMLLVTTTKMQMQNNDVKNYITNRTNEELTKWIEQDVNEDSKSIVTELIKNIKSSANRFALPEEVIKNLLALRNKVSGANEKLTTFTARKLLSNTNLRRKRDESTVLNDAKDYLEISELIITKSFDKNKIEEEKANIVNRVEIYMPNLCKTLYENNKKIHIELKTLSLSVTKVSKSTYFSYQTLPSDDSLFPKGSIKLGRKLYDRFKQDNNNKLCVGKAVFVDYFKKSGFIYLAQLYRMNGKSLLIQDKIDAVISLAINQTEVQEKSAHCVMWNNKNGKEEKCKLLKQTDHIINCLCDRLGYYFVEYKNDNGSENISKYHTSPLPISNNNKPEFTTQKVQSTATVVSQTTQIFTDTVSYVLISLSVIGIVVLCFAIKRLIRKGDEKNARDCLEFPKYAHLHDDDLLQNRL